MLTLLACLREGQGQSAVVRHPRRVLVAMRLKAYHSPARCHAGHPNPAIRYTYLTRRVYDRCMSRVRTNIEIEDTYLQAVMDRYGLRTKTEAVDLALRHLAGQPMTREEALAMRGAHALGDLPDDAAPRGAA
jgi:Arc/MetJ family transcription regulator